MAAIYSLYYAYYHTVGYNLKRVLQDFNIQHYNFNFLIVALEILIAFTTFIHATHIASYVSCIAMYVVIQYCGIVASYSYRHLH